MSVQRYSRREFVKATAMAMGTAQLLGVGGIAQGMQPPQRPAQTVLPRWRGFNLTYFFTRRDDARPIEDDFRWMQDWGFNFVRLPMSYELWVEPDDWYKVKEEMLARIDQVVELGQKYGLHVSLNFHRGPGYCVNPPEEKLSLWKDAEAEQAFCWHWNLFAKRYQGIDSKQLSFDLLNEPANPNGRMSRADYERVMRAATQTIRDADPQRYVIIDGLRWGRETVPELIDLGVGQSTRGYDPMEISHYKASWVQGERFPEPVWPDPEGKAHRWDRKRLEELYAPWVALAEKGVGVHCGECGCYNKTPHEVFLAWFRDVLEILTGHNIGYALWNFRGSFGLLDSDRSDVTYEDFHGRKLDRKLLALLQEF
ncbi:MAG: glycoside hydrolase family 5 protein [Pirellulaceae bacterium]